MQEVPSEAQCLQPGCLCGHSTRGPADVTIRTPLIFNKAPTFIWPGPAEDVGSWPTSVCGNMCSQGGTPPPKMGEKWLLTSVVWTENTEGQECP